MSGGNVEALRERPVQGDSNLLNVTFYGVRGSTPCPCETNRRYGGNTACVVVDAPGAEPIVLDLGTGLRFFGDTLPADEPFRGTALVTHLHWDHVQGLPFFQPILRPGGRLTVYGPPQGPDSMGETFAEFVRPPYFPVRLTELLGEIEFRDTGTEPFEVGGATVTAAAVPHVGPTNGYRIEAGGVVVVYVSDHQQPGPTPDRVDPAVVELCRGADLLIHDAQYTDEEFLAKADWGHCTVDYAVRVATEAGVRRLALFHHDPNHDDATLEALADRARRLAGPRLAEVVLAAEGLTVSLSAVVPSLVEAGAAAM